MIQSNTMTRLAVDVFKEEGQISISGHGVLKKVFLSAYVFEEEQKLHPPREHYYFNRNKYTDADSCLIRRVSVYFMLSEAEASHKVETWENNLLEKSRSGKVSFGDFGVFHFDEQLDFSSHSLLYYEWLPVMDYHQIAPVAREISSIVSDEIGDSSIAAMSPPRKKPVLPVLWSLLSIFFVFSFFLWFEPLSMLLDEHNEMNTRLVNVAPRSYSEYQEPAYYSDTNPTSQTKDSESTESGGNRKTITEYELKEWQDSKESDSVSGLTPGLSSAESETFTSTDGLDHKSAPIPSPCTLIVGAFKNGANVDMMINRLLAMNLKPITLERRTITLVGAEIKCTDQLIVDEIKRSIEPNAWFYTQ